MSDHVRVEILPHPTRTDCRLARIDGADITITDYSVEPQEQGKRAMVSLFVPADSVSIGEPPDGDAAPATSASSSATRAPSYWGAPLQTAGVTA